MPHNPVQIGPHVCGHGENLFLIAGPCVIESLDQTRRIAEYLAELSRRLSIPVIFKASFDKANRTSIQSYRGPGLDKGYTTQPSGGFNAGVEARKQWLPKTVDQLRTKTNPKVTFGLANHEGPAKVTNTLRGVEGRVEKNRRRTAKFRQSIKNCKKKIEKNGRRNSRRKS